MFRKCGVPSDYAKDPAGMCKPPMQLAQHATKKSLRNGGSPKFWGPRGRVRSPGPGGDRGTVPGIGYRSPSVSVPDDGAGEAGSYAKKRAFCKGENTVKLKEKRRKKEIAEIFATVYSLH